MYEIIHVNLNSIGSKLKTTLGGIEDLNGRKCDANIQRPFSVEQQMSKDQNYNENMC